METFTDPIAAGAINGREESGYGDGGHTALVQTARGCAVLLDAARARSVPRDSRECTRL